MNRLKNYFSESFPYWKHAMAVALPIMIQNGITNLVSMLDNIMVGRVGTLEMTGVSIVNQLILVFNLCIFGALSGVGIFTAQFYGKKDEKGIGSTLQLKLIFSLLITAFSVGVFLLLGDTLISAYIQADSDPQDKMAVAAHAKSYLSIMLYGTLPFALSQSYAGTLRETNDRITPMVSTIIAVFLNLFLNYCLIFGNLGFEKMGIKGAAIATVSARFVEFFILVIRCHTRKKRYPFIRGLFTSTALTVPLVRKIILISLPLLINEGLWASGMATLNQAYSVRGLDVVAAVNIVSTLTNVFNVSFIAFGSAIGIILSQMLGANKKSEAGKASTRLLFFATVSICILALVMCALAPLFPKIYNTHSSVQLLASQLITVTALFMPVQAFNNACYFTLRSGGKSFITFLFDSGFVWTISVPIAFCLSRFTNTPIVSLFLCIQAVDILKGALGYYFMKKGIWLNRVV